MTETTKHPSTPEQSALLLAVVIALAGNIIFMWSLAYLVATLVAAFVFVPKAERLCSRRTLTLLVTGASLVSLLMTFTAMGCFCLEGRKAAGIFSNTMAAANLLSFSSLAVLTLLKRPPNLRGPLLFFHLVHPVVVALLVRIGALYYGAHAFVSTL